MEGSKKRTSQRTETNIIIADGANIASCIYRREGEHHVMRIGAKIRQIRQHRHLTQRELGEKIGLGRNGANRIAQYEMGYRTPKRDQLNKIANALNVSEKTLSLDGDETLRKLLQTLFWLDQEDATLIELIPASKHCNLSENGHVSIVIHDTAFQELLTSWNTEKSLLEDGAITQSDYFDWKIQTSL